MEERDDGGKREFAGALKVGRQIMSAELKGRSGSSWRRNWALRGVVMLLMVNLVRVWRR